MNEKVWLSSPHMGGEELNFIHEAFDTNWIAPLGPNVNGFEKDLETKLSIQHAAALSSGTAAIHLALIQLGVGLGDLVIASSFTFSATINPIVYQGAKPVFVDSETDTWNMSPQYLEKAIESCLSKGEKPKAILLVHLYGMPAHTNQILEIAHKFQIPVIEDAAEGLGSHINGKYLGTFGEIGILSFNGNKIITTSGGGALISNSEQYVQQARFLSTQARDNAPHYQHSQIGYNYRMSNICAGIGRGQMLVLDERVKQRRANFEYYKHELSSISAIEFLEEPNGYFSNRWLTCILVKENSKSVTRETIRLALDKLNIESRPLWKPMHKQPVFEQYEYFGDGTSERLFDEGLCLPSGSNLSKTDLNRTIQTIKELF